MKYTPMDLALEHYTKLNENFAAAEYAVIMAEAVKPRYAPIPLAEALRQFDAGTLVVPDKVRLIWVHDIERPSDNYLAHGMAAMEREFGFRTTYNIRCVSVANAELRAEIDAIRALGHEIQYQYEDLVMTGGDVAAGRESFRRNLAAMRRLYPEISACYAHGVYKSGLDSTDLFKIDGVWHPELYQACGIEHRFGELYCFGDHLQALLGPRYHYIVESRCIGGEEFAAALRDCRPGDVVLFLQHPTWWSERYDVARLKQALRGGDFF